MTTRERKVEFLNGFGYGYLHKAVSEMFYARGEDWLTDEQLEDLTRAAISNWRATQRLNRRNRALAASREAVR